MKSEQLIDIHHAINLVRQGKPCASMVIKKLSLKENGFDHLIEDEGMKFLVEPLDDHWDVLYIFECELMRDIIKQTPNTPKSRYDHWVLGNLFGYSHEAIMKFIGRVEN